MASQDSVKGTCYLICLERPIGGEGRASLKHYFGWTNDTDVEKRLKEHRAGQGAKCLAHAAYLGIGFDVVRTWQGVDRHFERRMKNSGHHAMRCPRCAPAERERDNARRRELYARRSQRRRAGRMDERPKARKTTPEIKLGLRLIGNTYWLVQEGIMDEQPKRRAWRAPHQAKPSEAEER